HLYLHSFPTRRSSDLQLGKRWSLDIEKNTRDCPSNITTIVLVSPQIAPNFTSRLPQRTPVLSIPIAIGSGTFNVSYFTSPVSTPDRKSTRLNSSHLVI